MAVHPEVVDQAVEPLVGPAGAADHVRGGVATDPDVVDTQREVLPRGHQLAIEVDPAGAATHREDHVRPRVERQVVARSEHQPLLGGVAGLLEGRGEARGGVARTCLGGGLQQEEAVRAATDLEQRDVVGQRPRVRPDRHREVLAQVPIEVVGQLDVAVGRGGAARQVHALPELAVLDPAGGALESASPKEVS